MGKYKFQINLRGHWKDYYDEENSVICRAFMSGSKKAKYHLRGNNYEYDFNSMTQVNTDSGKSRKIRPPPNLKPPAKPIVPPGPTIMVVVPKGAQPGQRLQVPHPLDPSITLQVGVPPGAAEGATLLVPVPDLKKCLQDAQPSLPGGDKGQEARQEQHAANAQGNKNVALTAAGVGLGAAAVGGAAYGLAQPGAVDAVGGALSGAGDAVVDGLGVAGNAIAGAGQDAIGAVGGAAGAAGAAIMSTDAGAAVGGAVMGAADNIGDALAPVGAVIGDAMNPVIDEMGDAMQGAGSFIMNLF